MSELKVASLFEFEKVLQGRSNKLFYSKSEADKVIAEKDTKIIQLEAFIENYNRISREIIDNANHQKYKRCLDMAWGCLQRKELFHEFVLEEARTITLPNEVALQEYRSKRERAAKWHKRWLKLAEKFKEGK